MSENDPALRRFPALTADRARTLRDQASSQGLTAGRSPCRDIADITDWLPEEVSAGSLDRPAPPAGCRPAPYPRSSAPVAFATAATTFAEAASSSASVSVRSRGWNTTSIASDRVPSGTFSPS